MSERLNIIENVLSPADSYAVYGVGNMALGLDVEPRETLLERARAKWAQVYATAVRQDAPPGHVAGVPFVEQSWKTNSR